MVPGEYSGLVWFNYRTASGSADGNITTYEMGNGKAGYASIRAASFIRNGGTSSQFLKADGSVDSNSYSLSSHTHSYLPLTGGTLSGDLTVGAKLLFTNSSIDDGTWPSGMWRTSVGLQIAAANNGAKIPITLGWRNDSDPAIYIGTSTNVGIGTSSPSQKLEVSGNIKATSFIKSGGTSAQFLKADGSVDSNSYSLSNHGHSNYLYTSQATSPQDTTYGDSAINWATTTAGNYPRSYIYNTYGAEYSYLIGMNTNNNYGTILKLGYSDKYLRILRKSSGNWQSSDWEKISAGYADSAGSVAWGNVSGKPSTFTPSDHTHSYLPLSGGTITGTLQAPSLNIQSGADAKIVLNNTDNETYWSVIRFQQNGETYGNFGTMGSTDLKWGSNTLWHTGNLTKISQLTNDSGYITSSGRSAESKVSDYLRTPVGVTTRITSLNDLGKDNITISGGRTMMRTDLVTTSITDNSKPPFPTGKSSSGYLLSFSWEGNGFNGPAASQLYIPNGDHITTTNGEQTIMYRGNDNGTWTSWNKLVSARTSSVGSATQPIYINADGFATACTSYASASVNYATSAGNADTVDGKHASDFALSSHTHSYLPLSGGTMTGAIKYGGASYEIIRTGGDDISWRGGLKYSWSGNTTIALWGKHVKSQFVWHAGTDFSSNDVNGTSTRSYDFQVGRSNGTLEALIGGNKIWHAGNDGSGSGLDADLLDGQHASDFCAKRSSARFYNFIADSNSSYWYKVTLPFQGTTSANNRWMMVSMEIVLKGNYSSGADGKIFLRYYIYYQADTTQGRADNVYGIAIGSQLQSVRVAYQKSNLGIFYIYVPNNYNSIAIQNLSANDSAPAYDFRTTTLVTSAAPTDSDITDISIVRLNTTNGTDISIPNLTNSEIDTIMS